MVFSLMQNFQQPYFATSIKEFWRRWHISLTSWFTDYLYIPLEGNQKGNIRQYINILIVFSISGLWHGANWHFVAWGLLHACYQIFGHLKSCVKKKLNIEIRYDQDSFSQKLGKSLVTFILVDFAWIFFAADNMHHFIWNIWY